MAKLDIGAVFCIVVVPTGKRYVGVSGAVSAMWSTYLSKLRKGQHKCLDLQRAFDQWGEVGLKLETLESASSSRDKLDVEMSASAWAHKLGATLFRRGRPKVKRETAVLPPCVRARVAALIAQSKAEAALDSAAAEKRVAELRAERERVRQQQVAERMEKQKEGTAARQRVTRAVRRQANKLGLPLWAVRQSASFQPPKSREPAPAEVAPSVAVDDWGDPT